MKKTIITLLTLAGVAAADTTWDATKKYTYTWDFNASSALGGTVTNTFDIATEGDRTYITNTTYSDKTKKGYREDNTSFLYNAVEAAVKTGATLSITLDYYYEGSSWGETILHVGRGSNDTGYGVSFGIAASGYMSVITTKPSDANYNAGKSTVQLTSDAWNTITFTLSNNKWTASNGIATSNAITLGSINWDSDANENQKYSIGITAPGWETQGCSGLNDSGCKIANMSVTYSPVPEPTTATLSLLALAGLAARRRRRK